MIKHFFFAEVLQTISIIQELRDDNNDNDMIHPLYCGMNRFTY